MLNLNGDESRYGKELDGEVWEGKRTLILAHGLSHATPTDRTWIREFLSRPRERRLPREGLRLRDILGRSQSIEWAQTSANVLANARRASSMTRPLPALRRVPISIGCVRV